jgi:hypothetical protein
MVATVEMERVWDRTAAFLRAHSRTLLTVAALAMFVPAVLAGLVEAAAVPAGGAVGGAGMLVRLIASVLTLWAELAIVALAAGSASTRAALRQAGLRLPVVIGFALLLTLAMVLLSLPAVAILGAYGFDFMAAADGEGASPSAVAAAWIGLYLLVLLPLLLWIGARLSLVIPVVVEERRGLGAIARSFALTRGIAAKIIGMLLLYGVVSLVVTAAVQFAAGTVFAILFGNGEGLGIASVLTLLLTALVEIALAVLLWAFTGKLYLAARERMDGMAAHQ